MGVRSARDRQTIVELTDGTNEVNLGPRGLPIHGFDIDTIFGQVPECLVCMCQLVFYIMQFATAEESP